MPNAPETNRFRASGSGKDSHTEIIEALFAFPGLHQLAPTLESLLPRQRTQYPPALLLAVEVTARVTGSLSSAVAAMFSPGAWRGYEELFAAEAGIRGPSVPPNLDTMFNFKGRLSQPSVLAGLNTAFTHLAVGQARYLGNLLPGIDPNLARPSERHCIYGDGTVIKPYSKASSFVHPVTGELVLLKSRAKSVDSARIQTEMSDTTQDHKDVSGVNMVAIHTWTAAGRVVLATGRAMTAESWASLELIDEVVADLELQDGGDTDAVHALIYDGAVRGWHVDYLMGRYGIQVVNKVASATSQWLEHEERIKDPEMAGRLARAQAQYQALGADVDRRFATREITEDLARAHRHLPLGRSYYPTSSGYDTVNSCYRELDPLTHQVDGTICEHRVALDDGALFTIDLDPDGEEFLVKTHLLKCQDSRRHRRPDGRWIVRSRYTVPCEVGDFTHHRTWTPVGTRYTSKDKTLKKAPVDQVGWRLRPLNRADDVAAFYNENIPLPWIRQSHGWPTPFQDLFGRRNDSESYNMWFKQSLPHHGRANSEIIERQDLDWLTAGILNNSLTWTTHLQSQRLHPASA